MSALGHTGCQIAQEGLGTAKLRGLQGSYQRSDDRYLQWLCWM
jgi:hypothetical protein